MTNQELIEKLNTAQALLSDVYHYACENKVDEIERLMSCADDCIIESFNYLNKV